MTRLEIQDKVRKQLGETTASFWSDALIQTWINDGIVDVAFRTKSIRKNATMNPTTDTLEYTLSTHFSDMEEFLEVYHKNEGVTFIKLKQTNRKNLDIENPGWLSASSGAPTKYAYDLEEDWLILWPPPTSTNAASASVKAYYIAKPTDLSGDSSESQLPEVLDDAVIEYVKATGYESRGQGDRANNSRQIYLGMVKDYKILRETQSDDEIIMKIEPRVYRTQASYR